ncbi:MAG: tRNA pseudouridine(55) synthase TruB [Limnobacter sp.]|nr:tRNA pseudouridine(55) synthase TruB [Limnobacter sp.]
MKSSRRALSGVLLFDKSLGLSSNNALQRVKRLFNAEKTGHTGTLDPLASGLLPLMFGEATKFASDLIDSSKSYEATVRLGWESTTGDAEGELTSVLEEKSSNSSTTNGQDALHCEQLEEKHFNLTESKGYQDLNLLTLEQVQEVAKQFIGEVQQVPPMYSALKKDGKALYEYARKGEEVERPARNITIHALDVLSLEQKTEGTFLTFAAECSKGTYIRTLGEDLAKALNTKGYLTALRRTAIGSLDVRQAFTLQDLECMADDGKDLTELLQPVDALLSMLETVTLTAEHAKRFSQGQRLPLNAPPDVPTGRVKVYGQVAQDQAIQSSLNPLLFMGTGFLETDGKNALLRPDRLIQVKL